MRYKPTADGEPVEVPSNIMKLACCDCGLIHFFTFTPRKGGGTTVRAWRDSRATARKRKRIGIVIVKHERKG